MNFFLGVIFVLKGRDEKCDGPVVLPEVPKELTKSQNSISMDSLRFAVSTYANVNFFALFYSNSFLSIKSLVFFKDSSIASF